MVITDCTSSFALSIAVCMPESLKPSFETVKNTSLLLSILIEKVFSFNSNPLPAKYISTKSLTGTLIVSFPDALLKVKER
mgnify:CR=1 FL=1